MKSVGDPRDTFVEYLFHPLVRGFLRWARDRATECSKGSGREWPGLVGELELLLAEEYSGPDPKELICPAGVEGIEGIYPSRLIDHQIFTTDWQMQYLLDYEGIEGQENRLEWMVQSLDDTLNTQERILTRAAANRQHPPLPNYDIIENTDLDDRYRALTKARFICTPELDYPMSEYEQEMVKEYAQVTPPFEEFSNNPAYFLGVYRWLMIQAEEAALTGDKEWEGVYREFDNLERGFYSDLSPELIIASENPTGFDYKQLRYFYLHSLNDTDDNIQLVQDKNVWGPLSPSIESHIDADLSSPPAIAAWYLKTDLQYMEALSARTPQLVS